MNIPKKGEEVCENKKNCFKRRGVQMVGTFVCAE